VKDYEAHPIAELFPLLEGDELLEMVDSVRRNGLLHPIVTHEGKILDGRNRLRACELAEVEPTFIEWHGEGDLVDWVVATNLQRRHLTTSQRALIAVELKKRYEVTARDRILSGTATPSSPELTEGDTADGEAPAEPAALPRREASADEEAAFRGRAIDQAAKATGVSPRTVARAAKLMTNAAPELIAAVRTGDVSVAAASEIAKLPAEAQRSTVREKKVREAARAVRDASRPAPPAPPPMPTTLPDSSPLHLAEFKAAYRKGPAPHKRQPLHEVARLQQIAITATLVERAWVWINAEWDTDHRADMRFALDDAKQMTPLLKEFGKRLAAVIATCSQAEVADEGSSAPEAAG
jgi:hypothetical protein